MSTMAAVAPNEAHRHRPHTMHGRPLLRSAIVGVSTMEDRETVWYLSMYGVLDSM